MTVTFGSEENTTRALSLAKLFSPMLGHRMRVMDSINSNIVSLSGFWLCTGDMMPSVKFGNKHLIV